MASNDEGGGSQEEKRVVQRAFVLRQLSFYGDELFAI